MAGWKRGAKQNPIPTRSTQAATLRRRDVERHAERLEQVGGARTSDEAERLPCLHTRPPAPATVSAASVETLSEWLASPPEPTTSMTGGARRVEVEVDGGPGVEHGVEQAAQLLGGLALHAQGDDEAGDLGVGGRPRRGSPPWRRPTRCGSATRHR